MNPLNLYELNVALSEDLANEYIFTAKAAEPHQGQSIGGSDPSPEKPRTRPQVP